MVDGNINPNCIPIIMARKPIEGSIIDNIIMYNAGGLNIDDCRIKLLDFDSRDLRTIHRSAKLEEGVFNKNNCGLTVEGDVQVLKENGRFPANTILTYDESDIDEVCSGFPNGGQNGSITKRYKMNNQVYGEYGYCNTWTAYTDSGSASRYFKNCQYGDKDREEINNER